MLRFEKLPSPPMPKELELPQGISPRLARMLYARGARTGEAMEAFLHPSAAQLYDPFLFRDMDKAVARLRSSSSTRRWRLTTACLRMSRPKRHARQRNGSST